MNIVLGVVAFVSSFYWWIFLPLIHEHYLVAALDALAVYVYVVVWIATGGAVSPLPPGRNMLWAVVRLVAGALVVPPIVYVLATA